MNRSVSILRWAGLTATLAACGGGGGSGARPVVIPDVPAGAFEDGCQQLCTLLPDEKVCTAKHAEFCLANCRARTRDLPQACGDCLITVGTPISGFVDNASGSAYCTIGGPADLETCASACDDAGAAAPSPDLDVLCQLECSFYMQERTPLACSMDAAADCLSACRAAVATQPRVCAQCQMEATIPGQICINNVCDCANTFPVTTGCDTLCDTAPPP
jgi:hypothetical protein